MKLVTAEKAQHIREQVNAGYSTHLGLESDVLDLAATVQALWLWAAEQDCARGDFSAACDCIPCQARKRLVSKEAKP